MTLLTVPESDTCATWSEYYLTMVVRSVRSVAITNKIVLHLQRFQQFLLASYSHDRLSLCVQRDVLAWQRSLQSSGLAVATINNHLASLSTFTTWVHARHPQLFPMGDPAKGIRELALPPLEPRTLDADQVRSLKNLCDRLPVYHQRKDGTLRATGRPIRDRAIIFVLLSTGLRREELINLNYDQVEPADPALLHTAHRARIVRVKGKGQTERSVFLSADARHALAEYLTTERARDRHDQTSALFLSAVELAARGVDGRLSPRAINLILEQIGRWHDATVSDPRRRITPLRPHDLRHTFAFQLAHTTGADAYELERRLGHRSQRYIQRYTNPPEDVAATYIEAF
jgi:site-specific recombinase XerD